MIEGKYTYQELEALYEHERALNENLTRITRERANAERGLTPKKQRSGYILLESCQVDWRYRSTRIVDNWGRPTLQIAHVWRSRLETPWPALLDVGAADAVVRTDLGPFKGILAKLGLTGIVDIADDDDDEFDFDLDVDSRVAFKLSYLADFKTGHWTIYLWSKTPVNPDQELLPESGRVD